ncbi:DinB family protein [Paenibacillus qinlingensis]|uniref:Damage-inducible protein DinB n=1 Tax=Paenibacillus qinlingensis TaxID=1837343 RepID=A0ABU1P1W0_9BACL|nr:DinB family protein [Paenibacillus qinlingensis]MDR6553741.1 putative damage-inducible protein DinB [Paenibacillus qinlingensis]
MTQTADRMYDYHVWANQTLINRLKELPQEVYRQEIQSVFPTVAKVIAHIYLTDRTWLDILGGKSMKEAMAASWQITEATESKSLIELEAMYVELSIRGKAFLKELPDLEKKITLDNPYAGVRETSLAEIVLQIVNHATYHRGNVTAMLRQMGYASVMTEYALFWYAGAEQLA